MKTTETIEVSKRARLRILVAEDEPTVRESTALILRSTFSNELAENIDVVQAPTAEKALELLTSNGIDYALIDEAFEEAGGWMTGSQLMEQYEGSKRKLIGLTVHDNRL